ncbi:2-hydroxyacyl-CoA dehydratase [Patescibacteria group bacterium]|nr:2-hydroxyacyl-CoA dehydratase [Patescibacteria group bacterium]
MVVLPGNVNRKMQEKVYQEVLRETQREIASLKTRDDFIKELEYFLEVLSLPLYPQRFKERFKNPLAGLYCNSVPLELLDAFGFHPVRLCSGSLCVQKLSSSFLPILACPVIKSSVSPYHLEQSLEKLCDLVVMPTSCDWRVKIPEIIKEKKKHIYQMELPHAKESEKSQKRWLEESYDLKRYLERYTKKKLNCKNFLSSIHKYMRAWGTFSRLIELRCKGLISGTWSIIIANAFMLDDVESWIENTNKLLNSYNNSGHNEKPQIFLAGSPLFFPHLKISELIEEIGMFIVADSLCTSERLFNSIVYDGTSEYELLRAVAERYQLSCTCPTFVDNERKIKNTLVAMKERNIKGVVYHVFKGCHPFDMESFSFEKAVKRNGYHFIRIETDYSVEDKEGILLRLEAFKETLH